MRGGGVRKRVVAAVSGAAVVVLVATGVTSCSSSSTTGSSTTTTVGSTAGSGGSTTAPGSSAPATSTTVTTPSTALPDASEAQRSAPGDGSGTALLRAVRIGRNEGFERIVFEFEGSSVPGYRVQWVDGPITADGSGEPVEVAGAAHLTMIMEPASGVDLSAPELNVVYTGPDRIPTTGRTVLLTDLVRTGDFEAVLSWAAGTTKRVPFRVLTLSSPTRVVIDLAT